jgi:hypothetical protein
MTETWTRLRASALDAVGALKELLADPGAEDRRLVAGYLEAKQALAHAFEAFAVEKYADVSVLEGVKKDIEQQMREGYPRLPAKYLKVRGFGKSHARLVAYLVRSSGNEVSASELRMLTGDAVHTERRARELRDLGFELEAKHTGGTDVYLLRSAEPDVAAGAAIQVAQNIRGDRSLSQAQAADLLRSAGLA